jgi:hypothetical protein
MDPDTCLARIREIVGLSIGADVAPDDPDEVSRLLDELSEHMSSLDDWLSHGGFLPKDWDDRRIVNARRQRRQSEKDLRDATTPTREIRRYVEGDSQ